MSAYHDPFSLRAEEIARQAILRADSLGMEHYGPAPTPLDETRDMYQEAIEELLDAIYYLTRQVARLEDQRQRLVAVTGNRPVR
jgi:transposase